MKVPRRFARFLEFQRGRIITLREILSLSSIKYSIKLILKKKENIKHGYPSTFCGLIKYLVFSKYRRYKSRVDMWDTYTLLNNPSHEDIREFYTKIDKLNSYNFFTTYKELQERFNNEHKTR